MNKGAIHQNISDTPLWFKYLVGTVSIIAFIYIYIFPNESDKKINVENSSNLINTIGQVGDNTMIVSKKPEIISQKTIELNRIVTEGFRHQFRIEIADFLREFRLAAYTLAPDKTIKLKNLNIENDALLGNGHVDYIATLLTNKTINVSDIKFLIK